MNLYTTRIDCEVAGQCGGVVAPYVPPPQKEPPNARLGRNRRRNRKTTH